MSETISELPPYRQKTRNEFFDTFGKFPTESLLKAADSLLNVLDYPQARFISGGREVTQILKDNGLTNKQFPWVMEEAVFFLNELKANGDEWRELVAGWKENQEEI